MIDSLTRNDIATDRHGLNRGIQLSFGSGGVLATRPWIVSRESRLDAAKQWLKDNGGAHPGCLQRFMKARGMV